MAGAAETSKPRRIKALLSSFLKGSSKDEKVQSEKETKDANNGAAPKDAPSGTDDREGYVIVDEWPAKKGEPASTVQPQNRESFFERVETFSTSTWFAKPEEVSPLHCARLGWENIHQDSLKCVSCKEVVYGGLPQKWETEAYGKDSQKLQDSLKDGHNKVCPWPSNPCPVSFQEVQLANHTQVAEAYLGRVASIRCFGTVIPAIDRTSVLQVVTDETEMAASISGLVTGVLGEEPTSDYKERIEAVCLIALCGWSRSSREESQTPTMTCEHCRRNVGLWNFASLEERRPDAQPSDNSDEPAPKKLKVDKGPFDPIGEHRTWCPWTKPPSADYRVGQPPKGAGQAEEEEGEGHRRPAWQQLLTLLRLHADPASQKSDGVLTNKETLLKSLDNILGIFRRQKKEEPRGRESIQT